MSEHIKLWARATVVLYATGHLSVMFVSWTLIIPLGSTVSRVGFLLAGLVVLGMMVEDEKGRK